MSLFALVVLERFLVQFPIASLNFDSLFYSLAAIRFSEGNFSETFSGPWQPLLGWCAGGLVFLGLSPIHAIALLAAVGGGVAVLVATTIAFRLGGVGAALVTGAGLSTHPLLIYESASVRSDAIFAGLSTLAFGWFLNAQATKHFYLKIAILGAVLTLFRVAALPILVFMGFAAYFVGPGTKKGRALGSAIYFFWVGLGLVGLCSIYYSQFNLFVPSLNFPLNSFFQVTEWMRLDPGGFCRLYDGKNTVLSDLQFLDPTVHTLPAVQGFDPELLYRYRIKNFGDTFRLGFKILPIWVWGLVALGIAGLWRSKRFVPLTLGALWILFACGAQALSTAQHRFFLPMVPLLFLVAGLGAASFLSKYSRWIAVFLISTNLWAARHHMNPGFLLNGAFLNRPDLLGYRLLKEFGPGRRVLGIGLHVSVIAARARWRSVPCVGIKEQEGYIRDKGIEFVLLPKPHDSVLAPDLVRFFGKSPELFELIEESDVEALYRVRPAVGKVF